jgi:predicted transcriptional regulator
VHNARRSRLELYENIIGALAKRALTIEDIAFECKMNCVNLQDRLDFLMKHNLVDLEISLDNRAFYVLTRRGLAISRTLDITKRLEKLQSRSRIQTVAAFTKTDEEKK